MELLSQGGDFIYELDFSFDLFGCCCKFRCLTGEELMLFSIVIGSCFASWRPSIILHFEEQYFILLKLTTLICLIYEIIINYKQITLFLKK